MKNNILRIAFLLLSFISLAQNKVSNCNYKDSIFKLLPNELTFDVKKYKVGKYHKPTVRKMDDTRTYLITGQKIKMRFHVINLKLIPTYFCVCPLVCIVNVWSPWSPTYLRDTLCLP